MLVEHAFDTRSAIKFGGETAIAAVCATSDILQATGWCERRSFGSGQIQLRRARLVDDAVSRAYGYDESGCGPGTGLFVFESLAAECSGLRQWFETSGTSRLREH